MHVRGHDHRGMDQQAVAMEAHQTIGHCGANVFTRQRPRSRSGVQPRFVAVAEQTIVFLPLPLVPGIRVGLAPQRPVLSPEAPILSVPDVPSRRSVARKAKAAAEPVKAAAPRAAAKSAPRVPAKTAAKTASKAPAKKAVPKTVVIKTTAAPAKKAAAKKPAPKKTTAKKSA